MIVCGMLLRMDRLLIVVFRVDKDVMLDYYL